MTFTPTILFGLLVMAPLVSGSEAADLAVAMIRERATILRSAGSEVVASQLERLAEGVATGRVGVDEAAHLAALAVALTGAGSPDGRSAPANPPRSIAPSGAPLAEPSVILDLLDHGPLEAIAPPPPAVAQPPPAVGASPHPAPSPEPAVRTQILAVQPGPDGGPALIALDATESPALRVGMRLAVRRGGETLVLARVSQVKDTLAIAVIIPGTWRDGTATVEADDEVISVAEAPAAAPANPPTSQP